MHAFPCGTDWFSNATDHHRRINGLASSTRFVHFIAIHSECFENSQWSHTYITEGTDDENASTNALFVQEL